MRGNQAGIQCDSCDRWLHCKCINMSVREYKLLGSDHSEPWFCTTCVLPQFTDSFFNTSSDSAGDLTNETEGTETLDFPNKITRKGLILAHLNINSLLAHLDELKAYLLNQRLDILSLTETKLDSTVTNDELNIPGFSVAVRKDRTWLQAVDQRAHSVNSHIIYHHRPHLRTRVHQHSRSRSRTCRHHRPRHDLLC